jgi:hypothetical protein
MGKKGREGEEKRRRDLGLDGSLFLVAVLPVKSVRHHPLSVLPAQFVVPWLFLMDVPPAT